MKLTSQAREVKPSATLAMNELVVKKRMMGERVLHMGFGESPFPVHPNVRQALCENAGIKSYLPTQGILPLRKRISSFYEFFFQLNYTPEQVIIAPGSKILIFDALLSLDGPLLLPAPSWVSYQHQARLMGKKVYYIKTHPEESYRLTPKTLEEIIHNIPEKVNDQKILLLNYPNNPTGNSFSSSQLKELAMIAKDYNVIILSDEIYALISFYDQKHHSIAEFYPEGTLVTGGLSKDRSLGGFRLGVMLLPADKNDLLKAMLSIGSETWACAAAPIQYAAIEAYDTNLEIVNFIRDCTVIHQIMGEYIHKRLHDINVRCPSPQGAFYLFPDWNQFRNKLIKKGITTSKDLAENLINNWNVSSLPGSEFGMLVDDLCLRLATVDYNGDEVLRKFQKNRKEVLDDTERFINSVAPRIVAACDQLVDFTESIS